MPHLSIKNLHESPKLDWGYWYSEYLPTFYGRFHREEIFFQTANLKPIQTSNITMAGSNIGFPNMWTTYFILVFSHIRAEGVGFWLSDFASFIKSENTHSSGMRIQNYTAYGTFRGSITSTKKSVNQQVVKEASRSGSFIEKHLFFLKEILKENLSAIFAVPHESYLNPVFHFPPPAKP